MEEEKIISLVIQYKDKDIDGLINNLETKYAHITSLNLSDNAITDDEGIKIINAISKLNIPLRKLNLQDNRLTDEFVKAFVNNKNLFLQKLDLQNNEDITKQGMLLLLKYLREENGSLTILFFGTDGYSPLLNKKEYTQLQDYLKRNKEGQEKAEKAAFQVLLIANIRLDPTEKISNNLFGKLLQNTGYLQRKRFLIEVASELWKSRFDSVWWSGKQRPKKRPKTTESCISSSICSREATLVEATNIDNVFCSSYCQFMHYTGAPDLRGMNVEEINNYFS